MKHTATSTSRSPAISSGAPTSSSSARPCDRNVDPTCAPLTAYKNHFAYELQGYKSVPDYLREVMLRYRLGTPKQLGLH